LMMHRQTQIKNDFVACIVEYAP